MTARTLRSRSDAGGPPAPGLRSFTAGHEDPSSPRDQLRLVMDFPYQLRGDQRFPIIPLVLVAGERKLRVDALIDSGASLSVFQGSIADYLGLTLTAGERRIFQGVGGRAVGYVHVVRLIVDGYALRCRVAFSNQLAVSINLRTVK